MQIPFNKTYLTGKEQKFIEDVLQRRELSADGFYTKKVSSVLEKRFSLNRVLMTTSGTHALEMAVELIKLNEGDEVIMPSFTFPSTASTVIRQGARPIFAEIKRGTFNIDPDDIERKITKKTRAIIPVHYAGVACEMDRIAELASRYGLYIIEDAAQGVNARYKKRYLGGIGDLGCYSFHGSKNYTSGEGGALVINRGSEYLGERAEIIRDKGTDRARFLRNEVDQYSWVDRGSSYSPSELLMAILYAQIEELDSIKKKREKVFKSYYKFFISYKNEHFLDSISFVPEYSEPNYHIFYLKFYQKRIRDFVIEKLQERGISATFHYIPLHSSPMGKKLGYKKEDLALTTEVADTILRLPLYPELSDRELQYIKENTGDIFREL